ncbi:hypothetical protein HYY74_01335 [Candidatus Woesearchaeota archaeon]|nr:hypothetical protein [Candidatus Woesearchaeota archaeon]
MMNIQAEGLIVPLYYASSVHDLKSSKGQVLGEYDRVAQPLAKQFRGIAAMTDITRLLALVTGQPYHSPASVLVYVPGVRHFPDQDPPL